MYKKTFSYNLKRLRKESKESQKELAAILEVSVRHYQDIEYGNIDIPTSKLILLANHFGVSVDSLLFFKPEQEVFKNNIHEI